MDVNTIENFSSKAARAYFSVDSERSCRKIQIGFRTMIGDINEGKLRPLSKPRRNKVDVMPHVLLHARAELLAQSTSKIMQRSSSRHLRSSYSALIGYQERRAFILCRTKIQRSQSQPYLARIGVCF